MGKYVSDNPQTSGTKDVNGLEYLPFGYPRLSRQGILKSNLASGASYDNGIECMVCDANYIYAISSLNRRYVRKYDINTLEMVAEIYTGTIWTTVNDLLDLEQDDTYIYVSTGASSKAFAKLLKSNLSVVAKSTTAPTGGGNLKMFKGFLFVAPTDSNSIAKFNVSTMAVVATISGTPYTKALEADDNFLYFIQSYNGSPPFALYKYNESLVHQAGVQTYVGTSALAVKDGRFLTPNGEQGMIYHGEVVTTKYNCSNQMCQLSLKTPLGAGVNGRVSKIVQLSENIFIALVNGATSNAFYKGIFLVDIVSGVQIPMWDFHELFSDSGGFNMADIVVTPDKKYAILAIFDTISSPYFMHTLMRFPVEYVLDKYSKKV